VTTVLVVDDQSLIRRAVVDILESATGIEVLGEAANGREALTLTLALRPDVVLMDIRMPELDGIEATALICADPRLSATRVLILTTFEEDEYVLGALRAGASGFIGKGSEPDEIVRAVLSVDAGDALLSPAATRSLITKYLRTPPLSHAIDSTSIRSSGAGPAVSTLFDQLTKRELEVLILVANGRSNQEIADELFISPHTAKTHVNRIMTKLAAHDRAQLVIVAYENGLLTTSAN
jgi:DNA-binding NarL/FixJ family response regulator